MNDFYNKVDLRGIPSYSLKDAADAPYFYECLASLLKYNAPAGKISIIKWRKNMRTKIMNGSMLMYCGNPKHRESCRHKFWSMKS